MRLLLAGWLACATPPERVVTNEVLEVACGTCVYKLPEGKGCYWAVALDGERYPMAGSLPADHDAHAPDGMCNVARRARITGELRGGNFVASAFELLPAEQVPATPTYDRDDQHGPEHRAP